MLKSNFYCGNEQKFKYCSIVKMVLKPRL